MAPLAVARRLFDDHRDWALAVAGSAIRRIGGCVEADEVRQAAQVATWDRALAFDPARWKVQPAGDPFELFAYPTVYGACLMVGYRGPAGRATFRQSPLPADLATSPNQGVVDRSIDSTRRGRVIAEILAELPKTERHVIAEHYLGGVTLSAVAASLHTSPANISRIHSRALSLLRVAVARRGLQPGEIL